jgi:hypothetical protein
MSLIFCGRSTTVRFCTAGEGEAEGDGTFVVAVVFEFELSALVQPASMAATDTSSAQGIKERFRVFIFVSRNGND